MSTQLRWALAHLALVLTIAGRAVAQDSSTTAPTANVHWTTDVLKLDGAPVEAAWSAADSIVQFTQQDPHEGRAASMRTVVRLLAAADGLHVAFWGYDS